MHGLVIADIHFGKKDDKRLYKELEEVFFKKIEKEGKSLDIIVIAGDLYDRSLKLIESIYPDNFIRKLIEYSIKYDFLIRIIKGTKTHDYDQLDVLDHYQDKYFPRFKLIKKVEEEALLNDIVVLYLPEEYISNPKEYYKDYFTNEDGKYDMIFAHGTFDFVSYVPNIESERVVQSAPTFKAKELSSYSYGPIISGHIHIRESWKNKIYYTGSFSRFCFGEEKTKGFIEFNYDPESLDSNIKYIINKKAPKYTTFYLEDLEGNSLEEKINILNELKDQYEHIRIKSKINNEKDAGLIKELLSTKDNQSNIKIEIQKEDKEEIDKKYMFILERKYDIPTTVQKYIELKNNKKIDINIIKDFLS